MVTTRGGASGSSSNAGAKPMDERLHGFITSEITHGIMEATPMIFSTIKEGIMELPDERLRALRVEIDAVQIGARTPSFQEFMTCGASEFFGDEDPITSRRRIVGIKSAQ